MTLVEEIARAIYQKCPLNGCEAETASKAALSVILQRLREPDNERNFRIARNYDMLMREGKHGHYETLFKMVNDELRALADHLEGQVNG